MKDKDMTYTATKVNTIFGPERKGYLNTDSLPKDNCSNCNTIITKPLHSSCKGCINFCNHSPMTIHRLDNRK